MAVLRGLASRDEVEIVLPSGSTLMELAEKLVEGGTPVFKQRLLNGDGSGLAPDLLVFMDGVEASMRGGSDAKLDGVREVVFLPSVHGG